MVARVQYVPRGLDGLVRSTDDQHIAGAETLVTGWNECVLLGIRRPRDTQHGRAGEAAQIDVGERVSNCWTGRIEHDRRRLPEPGQQDAQVFHRL